jgi:hypothetical protein
MRWDKRGLPNIKELSSGMERGETIQKQHDNLVLTIWKDTKPVRIFGYYITYIILFKFVKLDDLTREAGQSMDI